MLTDFWFPSLYTLYGDYLFYPCKQILGKSTLTRVVITDENNNQKSKTQVLQKVSRLEEFFQTLKISSINYLCQSLVGGGGGLFPVTRSRALSSLAPVFSVIPLFSSSPTLGFSARPPVTSPIPSIPHLSS